MNRREAILGVGCTAVSAAIPCFANARACSGEKMQLSACPEKLVINGNLVPPIDSGTPLDSATKIQVRSSGLTALKCTLGGSGNKSKTETDAEIANLLNIIAHNSDLFMQILSPGDLCTAKKTGRIGIIFSFEAAEMHEGTINNIAHFRSSGVLVMGLSYNANTPFASGVLSSDPTGLTNIGREALHQMNSLGVTVDISHSDELSSAEAIDASAKPVLITHAGCSAIHPHPRNKSDTILRTLAQHGGVVGIYELSFLVPPPAQPALDDYLAHMIHALNLCGEDHVGIGTDGSLTPFDTSPASMDEWNALIEYRKRSGIGAPGEGPPPFVKGLNRSDRCTVIADALRNQGYSARIADKILGMNFARVFEETWRL